MTEDIYPGAGQDEKDGYIHDTVPAQRSGSSKEMSLVERLRDDVVRMARVDAVVSIDCQEAAEEIEEHDQSFDLRWNADMRAIKRWQAEEPGRELTWPDHADLCVWLLNRMAGLEAALDGLAGEMEQTPTYRLTASVIREVLAKSGFETPGDSGG